jgi:hypothetical protein
VAESFDPYSEWLGIQSDGQSPDHYRLLGLTPFEPDLELITRAADAAMAKVRRIRPGAHLTEWSRMLDQLNTTKHCLLDPRSRKAYDERLARRTSVDSPVETKTKEIRSLADLGAWHPHSAEKPIGSASRRPFEPRTASQTTPSLAGYENERSEGSESQEDTPMVPVAARARTRWVLALLLLVMIAIAGAVRYMASAGARTVSGQPPSLSVDTTSRETPQPVTPSAPAPSPVAPSPVAPSPVAPSPEPADVSASGVAAPPLVSPPAESAVVKAVESAGTQNPVEATTAPELAKTAVAGPMEVAQVDGASTPSEPAPAAEAAASPAFTKAIAAVREAFSDRDLEAAGKQIRIADEEAGSQENRDQVRRLEIMLENLTQFWGGIRASMTKLQAAEELVVKDVRIVVVDSSGDRLTVKALGRVHHFEIANMPASLVMALVEQCFGRDAGSKAIIATFLAVDPNGDRGLAKEYWREAASAGIDTERLLPEVDAMSPVVSPKSPKPPKRTDRKRSGPGKE